MINNKLLFKMIRSHYDSDNTKFDDCVKEIVNSLDEVNKSKYSNYLLALGNPVDSFTPQRSEANIYSGKYLNEISTKGLNLYLPTFVVDEIRGISHAINRNVGIHRFLFFGAPGTGKTESIKAITKNMNKRLLCINISSIIDSKLGQTSKNIDDLISEINNIPDQSQFIILFDEIDSLALDRVNTNDIREMGRVTSQVLKLLDTLSPKINLFATTNLHHSIDRALLRRFDFVVDFDKYTFQDISDISEKYFSFIIEEYELVLENKKTFSKLIENRDVILSPAEMKNIIKTSILFSNEKDKNEYLKRLFTKLFNYKNDVEYIIELRNKGFTLHDLELTIGISKSKIDRMIKQKEINE